jgi:hypothetical protein
VTSYKIANLSSGTSQSDRRKLQDALMATPGVNVVTVSPSRGEVSITFRMNKPVERDVLATAISGAGFFLQDRSDRWTG